jgi:hypothetical protein
VIKTRKNAIFRAGRKLKNGVYEKDPEKQRIFREIAHKGLALLYVKTYNNGIN